MINLLYHLKSLKWALPTTVMFGVVPGHVIFWGAWRSLTVILPRRLFEIGDDFFWGFYQRLMVFFYEHYTGSKLWFYNEAKKTFAKKENVLFIMNHQSAVDWVVVDMLAARQGRIGQLRYVLKDGLRYFPIYGYMFQQHSCVYVKRGGKFQEDKAVAQLKKIQNNNTKFWMVVFPEGTRYNPGNPGVIEKSRKYAGEQGLAELEHHLTPRVKAAWLCVNNLREKIDAVYDVTIAYTNTFDKTTGKRSSSFGMTEYLNSPCPELHISVNRVDIKEVPSDESTFKHWLYDRFVLKDKLLQRFYSTDPAVCGTLGDSRYEIPLSLAYTLPAFLSYVAINISLLCTPWGRQIYWQVALGGTLIGLVWVKIRS